jgi:sporulation protein YlmC with PRC-barrel domain
MLQVESAIKGYAIAASDGQIGAVSDVLFDDQTWTVRWLVIDTGAWLPGRKVLIHPSAIGHADHERHQLSVTLTKTQVEGSPSIFLDQPVSRQMELHLYDYYCWDAGWGDSYFAASPHAIAAPFTAPPTSSGTTGREPVGQKPNDEEDPHLRSIAAITGYHIQATDGEIGHVEDFLVDDAKWGIRYLIIDTKNWWPGQHVLISPYAVRKISWPHHQIELAVTRDQIKASPPWKPIEMIGQAYEERLQTYEKRLHEHYGWPGYGWF